MESVAFFHTPQHLDYTKREKILGATYGWNHMGVVKDIPATALIRIASGTDENESKNILFINKND